MHFFFRVLLPGDLSLRRLDSTYVNGTGQVIVNAHLIAHSRVDAVVENIVGRLSLEQTICAARWQVQTSLDLDHQSLTVSEAAGLVPTVVEYSNARAGATMEHARAGIVGTAHAADRQNTVGASNRTVSYI